jgi:signal transduction histidine kinase
MNRVILVCCLLLCGLLHGAFAAPLALTGDTGRYELGPHLDYLEDVSGSLALEDVIAKRTFRPMARQVPNFGFTRSAWWFRLTLENQTDDNASWLLENQFPVLDYYDVHMIFANKATQSHYSGDMRPFSRRDLSLTNPVFALHLARGERVTLYFRSGISGTLQLPLVLWHPVQLAEKNHREQILRGLYYGLLLALFLYNLMIFIAIRDSGYGFYLLYLGGFLLFQMTLDGLAFEYLWPAAPVWGNQAFPFFFSLMMLALLQFSRVFLQMGQGLMRLDRWFLRLGAFFLAMMAAVLVVPYAYMMWMVVLGGVLLPPLIFVVSVLRWRQGASQALFFLLAFGVLGLGGMLYALSGLGILPRGVLTEYGLQIGSALEVFLLSFGLADRMRTQKDANARIMREAGDTLEHHVRLRTQSLVQAHAELALSHGQLESNHQQLEALHDKLAGAHQELASAHSALTDAHQSLQTTRQQLFLQEKMASLGTLAAGVAHEINNPTNFTHVAAQNQRVNLAEFAQFVQSMLDDAPDAALVAGFSQHFSQLQQDVAIMLNGTERIKTIVRDLRSVARIDETEKKSVRLSECLQSTLNLVRASWLEQIEFSTEIVDDPEYECWPALLNQVFMNLLVNACQAILEKRQNLATARADSAEADSGDANSGQADASAAGLARTAKGHIWLRQRCDGPMLRLEVEDDGIGMSLEVRSRIAEPFFTTKPPESGTGLGMSIAQDIIQKHRGTLEIESTPGQGSRFVLRLPLPQAGSDAEAGARADAGAGA